MKLELLSLHAVNCGPLRDVRIDFSDGQGHARPIILVAGANGSGKTTVLELIADLASLLDDDFDPRKSRLAQATYSQLDVSIDGNLLSLFYGKSPADKMGFHNDYGANTFGELLEMRRHPNLKNPIATDLKDQISSAARGSLDSLAPIERHVLNSPSSILYFPYLRNFPHVDGRQLARSYTTYEWVYKYQPATRYAGSLSNYLTWIEYSEPEVYVRVQEFLNGLFPDRKRFEVERRQLRGIVITNDGQKHGLEALSSGEQNLLVVLLEIYRRIVPGSIVLIDEIENSLHPAFQHRMAQGLLKLQREVPFQLIATSHADAFIDVFGTTSVRVLPMPKYSIK